MNLSWFKDKPIIVPFDFSEQSKSAVEVAIELAAEPANVHILHVIPHLVVTEPGVIWDAIDDEQRKTHAREAMAKALSDSVAVALDVGIGDPGYVIVDVANEIQAGLVVIPSHGRTGLSRVLMGSVAERVVRHAHCPVLVLKK